MSKINKKGLFLASICFFVAGTEQLYADEPTNSYCKTEEIQPLNNANIADLLGWVEADNRCGGYYLESPFIDTKNVYQDNAINITGKQGIFSLHGTSIYQGKVTVTQEDQQLITNKAYLYRDPVTEKYSGIDLIGSVNFREPNSLVLARCGYIDLKTQNKSMREILYRTAIYSSAHPRPNPLTQKELQEEHKVYQLSAWGKADEFKQNEPKVYEFKNASYSTCPPLNITWQVDAKDITLNKNTGRGIAKNARFLIHGVPVFYAPYLNFPIDSRRQTGFLWPSVGSSSTSGATVTTPFYWNLAPNYDDTITPSVLAKRGLQVTNLFRYLDGTPRTAGGLKLVVLPYDQLFRQFKEKEITENQHSTNPVTISELHALENDNTTRGAISWQHKTFFNEHWTTNIDYNWVSDDYYLQDFSNNLNEITPNQLLQQADVNYKGQYWAFTGRVQGYQTLHPIEQNEFFNQYARLPELMLDGGYIDDKSGVNFFIGNDFTYFDIAKNPGNLNPSGIAEQPVGNRFHTQPGVSLPIYRASYYVNPRLQFALTQYQLNNVIPENPTSPSRVLPIFDVNSGLYFDRNIRFFKYNLQQTLEPKMYYTYVPFKDQNQLPIFDTTTNTLTYDQLFTYNRFSGLDRIGDANQISLGVTTRFIDQETGYEKISAGVGQILYFEKRRVTLCETPETCASMMDTPENTNNRSPLSAVFTYNLTPGWQASAYTIWDSMEKQLNNQTFTLQYARDIQRAVSLSYSYVRNGDIPINPQIRAGSSTTNLSQTDLSFTWPLARDWSTVGRWTENWNRSRFQNLLYGLQYDTCCWAVRVVGGRTFNSLTPNDRYQYNTEFYIQFALKGLGNFGTGNPGKALNNATIENQTNFGQDY